MDRRKGPAAAATVLNFSIAGLLGAAGYLLESSTPDPLFWLIPIFLEFFSFRIIVSRFQVVFVIAGYIKTFLERDGELQYETRVSHYARFSPKTGKLGFVETVFTLYFAIGAFFAVLLYLKVHSPLWVAAYAGVWLPVVGFLHWRYVRKDWRAIFERAWAEVLDR